MYSTAKAFPFFDCEWYVHIFLIICCRVWRGCGRSGALYPAAVPVPVLPPRQGHLPTLHHGNWHVKHPGRLPGRHGYHPTWEPAHNLHTVAQTEGVHGFHIATLAWLSTSCPHPDLQSQMSCYRGAYPDLQSQMSCYRGAYPLLWLHGMFSMWNLCLRYAPLTGAWLVKRLTKLQVSACTGTFYMECVLKHVHGLPMLILICDLVPVN